MVAKTREEFIAELYNQTTHTIFSESMTEIISYRLIKTTGRLTLDIIYQHPDTRYMGDDDGQYWVFKASNGYEVISRSRMDLYTNVIYVWGAKENTRSGTQNILDPVKRDREYDRIHVALQEWADQYKYLDNTTCWL